ncbi:hypothetical protein B0H66DRAFT_84389 [Apodospora peruviana]|uniref:C2H2-type domain-containing protein n=1 Tax=Apodospora peruviana TaxID=516989 RepID=A0AAE0ITU3_9PEZI|nr:hypothetical protein B0H66DRAFT_84389 [Apodospora peruviana]
MWGPLTKCGCAQWNWLALVRCVVEPTAGDCAQLVQRPITIEFSPKAQNLCSFKAVSRSHHDGHLRALIDLPRPLMLKIAGKIPTTVRTFCIACSSGLFRLEEDFSPHHGADHLAVWPQNNGQTANQRNERPGTECCLGIWHSGNVPVFKVLSPISRVSMHFGQTATQIYRTIQVRL